MPQSEVKATVAILRAYFIADDRDELGRNTGARFKSKKMDLSKGSATAYIAKYISKNIDGYALAYQPADEMNAYCEPPRKGIRRLVVTPEGSLAHLHPFG